MIRSAPLRACLGMDSPEEWRGTGSDLRILMVEDNEADAELAKRALVRGGLSFRAEVVVSREAFLERLEGFHPQVILSDFTLPGFSGEDAIDIARERCPEVPFIFVSGTLGEECAVDLLKRGAWDYVLKDRPARLAPAVVRSLDLAAELSERRRLEEARNRAEHVVSAQNRVLESIACGSLLRTTLTLLATEIESQLPGCRVAVMIHPEEDHALQLVVAPSLPAEFQPVLSVLRQREDRGPYDMPSLVRDCEVVRDLDADSRFIGLGDVAAAARLRGYWSLPISASDSRTALGLLAIFHDGAGEPTSAELQVARASIRLASIAVERDRVSARAAYRALHDPLTGLPNRLLLIDRLSHALASAKRRPTHLALLMIDLDRFKLVNDGLGHSVGDQLLVAVARRLASTVRPGDTVARFGGDEFVFLSEDMQDEGQARAIANRLLAVIARPFDVAGRKLYVNASIGIVTNRCDDTPEIMLSDADIAMYQAKDLGRGRAEMCDEAMRKTSVNRLGMETALREGLDRGELQVQYQPLMDLTTGEMFGLEALVRWDRPDHGRIMPADFIPLAEETGLITSLGSHVLAVACADAVGWPQNLAVSVNVSGIQFRDSRLEGQLDDVLRTTGLSPGRLLLEITETVLMDDPQSSAAVLAGIRNLGVRIAVDDFGTGYSSLAYLKRFTIDHLKIDRSFVAGLGNDSDDTVITAAIVNMAHSLGLRALAEGVETEEQLASLQELGCDLAQGFYWSPAVGNRQFFAANPDSNGSRRDVSFEVSLAGAADAVRLSPRAVGPEDESA
jgi:diguanylate cyclase (GGDEF)-like protein